MKKRTVAVDDSLSPIMDILRRSGYYTAKPGTQGVDAIIINGIDDNLMGMEDINQDVPIINAQGKTAEQVLKELERKF